MTQKEWKKEILKKHFYASYNFILIFLTYFIILINNELKRK